MFINLYLRFKSGPHAGEVMPIMCLGEDNLIYRLDEMATVSGVDVVDVKVIGGVLSEPTQDRVRALLAEDRFL
jgi:hypothetical protein